MILFKPRVGKVIFAQTISGFSVIVPLLLFFFAKELTKCKSQNEKEIMSCKSLLHILVFN